MEAHLQTRRRQGVNHAAFIRANTTVMSPPLVPELKLHLAHEAVPLWQKTEEELDEIGLPHLSGPSHGPAAKPWRGTSSITLKSSVGGASSTSPRARAWLELLR